MKNTALARRVMAHIDRLAAHPGPDRWDQEYYAQREQCGTTACFAGWTVILGRDFTVDDLYVTDVAEQARELLGLTLREADQIFYLYTTDVAELRAAVETVFGPLTTEDTTP